LKWYLRENNTGALHQQPPAWPVPKQEGGTDVEDPSDSFALPNAYSETIRNHANTLAWGALKGHDVAADALMDLLNDVDAELEEQAGGPEGA